MKEGGCEKEKEVQRGGGSEKGGKEEGQKEGVRQRGGGERCDIYERLSILIPVLTTLTTYSDYSVAIAMRRLHTSDLLRLR